MSKMKRLFPLLLWVACSQTSVEDSPGLSGSATIDLKPISYLDWVDRLEELKGKIVVVDFWATWCSPCLERFPHMVELSETLRDRDVRFISMCLDDRSDRAAIEAARQFLRDQNATFQNYLMDENILDAFEKLDILGIPAVFIYDRNGKLAFRLTGDDPRNQFTDADVRKSILALLEQ